ncbi:MAG TPA: 5-(carboxyamino)imidazole ribonucleotide synthase [Verrucomicrobiota bacterium]|nr:5-(carboxyamino)imidazole ribonucleotide synthase [Verrucomicrobiota bacterium]
MHETIDAEIQRHTGHGPQRFIPNHRLGIIGGGQLAKMTALSVLQLGCDVAVLERNPSSPAAVLATHSLVGDWDSPAELLRLAAHCDVVTLENEFVDARGLAALEASGHKVFPTAKSIALVQDKLIQKQTLAAAGLPVTEFRAVANPEALAVAARELGLPLLLKARRNAYDGKGNVTVRSLEEFVAAWRMLGGQDGNELFVEAFCPFVSELAVIITRGRNGECATYPLVETVQRDHICHIVRAPAVVSPEISATALDIARRAVTAVGSVGSFGVEMFLTADGNVFVNELAPRVHNSGHYTIEACECSQFENHVRAVLGWPLGSTRMIAPAAVMVNLLGVGQGPGRPAGLDAALAVAGAHVHIYGKAMSNAGRKMGHVTALGDTSAAAEQTALRCARQLQFGNLK